MYKHVFIPLQTRIITKTQWKNYCFVCINHKRQTMALLENDFPNDQNDEQKDAKDSETQRTENISKGAHQTDQLDRLHPQDNPELKSTGRQIGSPPVKNVDNGEPGNSQESEP